MAKIEMAPQKMAARIEMAPQKMAARIVFKV